MHVEVGPVSSASAEAWIGYARQVLDGARLAGRKVDAGVSDEVAETFRHFLDEWQSIADRGGDFKWTHDLEPDQVEYLVHAFYRAAQRMSETAQARGRTTMPPDAAPFYSSLVAGLLDALQAESAGTAGFAEE